MKAAGGDVNEFFEWGNRNTLVHEIEDDSEHGYGMIEYCSVELHYNVRTSFVAQNHD